MRKLFTASFVLLALQVQAQPPVTSIEGIQIETSSPTHWVYVDIWSSYEGFGPEETVASLPSAFKSHYQAVWVQPHINVTKPQLRAYQEGYPQSSPLILDRDFTLMKQHDVWATPHHILTDGDKVVFSGSNDELVDFVNQWKKEQ